MRNTYWVSVWGNAVSVAENRPERYAKNITIRYPIHIPFSGKGVRLTFDNYCGTESVTLNKVTVLYAGAFYPVLFGGKREVMIPAGERAVSIFWRCFTSSCLRQVHILPFTNPLS